MPYTINIPKATDFISASQPLIQQNFTELQNWASIDHSPLASAAGTLEGFHYKTTFVPQGPPLTAAIPTFPATYPGLYAAPAANVAGSPQTGFNELYLQLNSATNKLIPLTAARLEGADPGVSREGYFYLPGGLLVKYGNSLIPAGPPANTYAVTYTVAANRPVFAAGVGIAPIVLVTPFVGPVAPPSSNSAWVSASSSTVFNFSMRDENGNNVGAPAILWWMAIGRPA